MGYAMTNDCYVLGLNYRPLSGMDIGHHPAAVLLKNGEIVAMCEEERFVRVKEAPGLFPLHAIQFCLARAGIRPFDLAAVGWNWNPEKASERTKQQKSPVVRSFASVLQYGLRHTPLRTFAPVLANGFLPERAVNELKTQLF